MWRGRGGQAEERWREAPMASVWLGGGRKGRRGVGGWASGKGCARARLIRRRGDVGGGPVGGAEIRCGNQRG